MSTDANEIAYRFRKLRKQLGIPTQERLAETLDGISRAVVAKAEASGVVSKNLAVALAERYAVNVGWLLMGEGEMLRADVLAHQAWKRRDADREARAGFERLKQSGDDDFQGPLPHAVPAADDPEPPESDSAADHVEQVWRRYDDERQTEAREPRAKYNVDAAAGPELELERMQDCIQVLAEAVQARGTAPTPQKFAAACILLYEASRSGGKANRNSVQRLMDTLA